MIDIGTKIQVANGDLVVQRSQDCNPIAEFAKRQSSAGFTGSSDMKHAATIPYVMVEKYCNDHGIEFAEFMKNKEHIRRVLSDPAMAHFRIWKGKI